MLSLPAVAQDTATPSPKKQEAIEVQACAHAALQGFRPIAETRAQRFNGKVTQLTALCRGGNKAVQYRYDAVGRLDAITGERATCRRCPRGISPHRYRQFRGVTGALLDLEYQRIELIKFNLFDNNGTYQDYVAGRDGGWVRRSKSWPQMRLPQSRPVLRRCRRRRQRSSARAT